MKTTRFDLYIQSLQWLFVAALFMLATPLRAAWNPFIVNFDKSLYGRGTQTWQIAPYDEKWTFMANRNGVVMYDGSAWTLFPLQNGSEVRSVHISEAMQRIYVGGINEFGYLQPGPDGAMDYHCLSDSLHGNFRFLGNVWGIHEVDHVLYFQGDDRVVKCFGGHYTQMPVEGKIDCSSMVNNVLYLGTDHGVLMLVGKQFLPLPGGERLAGLRIRGIVPFRKGVLIATAYDGLFYSDGSTVEPFVTGAEAFMKQDEVFCVTQQNGLLALGTVHHGVLLIDTATLQTRYFNEDCGLHNNTVLSLAFDVRGNLWAGLDNGLNYIWLNSSFTNLYSYPYSYGAGYTALPVGNRLFLGTNRGLYYTDYPLHADGRHPNLHPVELSSGQVWNLRAVGDEIFCLHDRGLFRIEGTTLHRVTDIAGVWDCQLVKGFTTLMYVGYYNGLYLLAREMGEWKLVCKIDGINDSCRTFQQQDSRTIWLVNSDQLTCIHLSEDLRRVEQLDEYDKGSYPMLWAHLADSIGVDVARPDSVIAQPTPIKLVPTGQMLVPIDDSTAIVPYEDGFALYNRPRKQTTNRRAHSLAIRCMYLSYPIDSLVYTANYQSIKPHPVIDYALGSVRFEYDLPYGLQHEAVAFRYRLNHGKWSDFSQVRTKEYSNMTEGDYTFEVMACFPDGSISTDEMAFTILPPWYRSIAAYVVYSLLIALFFYLIYLWDDRRMHRKKQLLAEQKDMELREVAEQKDRERLQMAEQKEREMKAMEREYEAERAERERQIMLLEKERLEHDLEHKGQELTNVMINFTRKNEMLAEIKADIQKVSLTLKGDGAREGRKQLLLINNKINENIQSDDLLKRIEEQFDLVHNNYMKRLMARHPDLSVNERMMCAYLKMNLTTKEIAPLLNISVRGVETLRYRLRKKFGLEREDNLVEYLEGIL